RTIRSVAGTWLLSPFDGLLHVLGAFLLCTGVKMALAKEDESGSGEKPMVRWLRGHLRMPDPSENEHFLGRKNGLLSAR
ncbi:hypothetical protein ACQWHJ_26465, partial [Salmonella enterica subsp. enterica serovar Infantis]